MKIKIENYHIEKFAESSVSFLFDVHLEDGMIGTCNICLQDIYHQLRFGDDGGNKFLFQPSCQKEKPFSDSDITKSFSSNDNDNVSTQNITKEEPVEKSNTGIIPLIIKVEKAGFEFPLTNFEKDVTESRQAHIGIPENGARKSNQKQSPRRSNRQRKPKLFDCEECGGSFTFTKLSSHKKTHKSFSNHKCKPNVDNLNKERNLTMHQNIHKRKKTYACQYCKKSCINKSALDYHLNIHKGIKPFTCKECGKSFTRKYTLQRHVKIHSGVRNFVCEDCGKSYASKTYLATHQNSIHKGKKSFFCSICRKGYMKKTDWMLTCEPTII